MDCVEYRKDVFDYWKFRCKCDEPLEPFLFCPRYIRTIHIAGVSEVQHELSLNFVTIINIVTEELS